MERDGKSKKIKRNNMKHIICHQNTKRQLVRPSTVYIYIYIYIIFSSNQLFWLHRQKKQHVIFFKISNNVPKWYYDVSQSVKQHFFAKKEHVWKGNVTKCNLMVLFYHHLKCFKRVSRITTSSDLLFIDQYFPDPYHKNYICRKLYTKW